MKQHDTTQEDQILSATELVCNQGVAGSSPAVGTNKNAGFSAQPEKSRTGSRTGSKVYYLDAWGNSWRIVDPKRGHGHRDSVCVCTSRDDALLILNLLNGGR